METEATEPPGRGPLSGGHRPECAVEVVDATGRMDPSRVSWVSERARGAARFLGCGGEVRVRVVDDLAMSSAHEKHLGDPSTTDVMTFDMADGASGTTGVLDADVLVCLDEARRQGEARGHGEHLEVLLYVVHAMLHCVGFDDRDEASSRAMHEREDQVLSAIGVGAIYHTPASKGGTFGPEGLDGPGALGVAGPGGGRS